MQQLPSNSTTHSWLSTLKLFTNRRLLIIFLLGFASGLPLLLIGSTLQAWYTEAGINIVTIGALTLIGIPYTWKFVWSPLMDRFVPAFLGRRRGWLLITQVILFLLIGMMAFMQPGLSPMLLAITALIVAFMSASQDIAINAYQTDILLSHERGPGSAMYVGGYRLAMYVTGGLALIMAQFMGWHLTYMLMAGLMFIGILATLLAPEPQYNQKPPNTLGAAVIEPFREFLSRKHAIAILIFIVIYKLSYAFILTMTPTFLLRDLGFSLADVGTVNKIVGISATILGVFIGGSLTARFGIFRALLIFGFLQAFGNLSYMLLAIVGKNYPLMVTAITLENFFAGMETAAFVAFIMSLCDHRFTATQFALLSALAAYGRVFVGPFAGVMIEHIGWASFYFWTFIIALPGLILLYLLRKPILQLSEQAAA